ncbi:transmembrane protein 238-like [Hemicordylus capensis]|uniref:transmembrane protein 238-like n=1 Tax=Hemicordylus capensis TaxID=884348 RepID=UPI002303037F|nr:transmembrane protein 238-like [Hemicordylus capensis]
MRVSLSPSGEWGVSGTHKCFRYEARVLRGGGGERLPPSRAAREERGRLRCELRACRLAAAAQVCRGRVPSSCGRRWCQAAAPEQPASLPACRMALPLGRCAGSFWLALAFDGAGLALLLCGVFADLFFADMLLYGGGLILFLSLVWWVFWYVGNLEVPLDQLLQQDDAGQPPKTPAGLVRSLSQRLSAAFGSVSRAASASARRRPAGVSSTTGSNANIMEMQPV